MHFKRQHHYFILLFLQSVPLFLIGQNLVLNPSFENYKQCPVALGNFEKDVVDWTMPTLGSTDYFNGCSTAMGTPENFNGKQPANFGVGYMGFYMYAPNDYREYIQAELSNTLKQGERYTISFYVSLAERSDFAVKEFGVRFTEFPVEVETSKVLSGMHFSKLKGNTSAALEISYSKYYSDEIKWVKLMTEFVATGTENYMVIGNFKNNKRTQKYQTKRKITKGSYYYLDMVSVSKVKSKLQNTAVTQTREYALDSIHVFKDVYFNSNKAKIRGNHQQEMESLLSYLTINPSIHIQILGHTDDVGSDTFNQKLSVRRAKEVVGCLTENGIQKNRISSQGFGSSKSIATNKTKAGRFLNRRVEFILSKPD
ncbi:OmpA family protein [Maribacter sp. SA7]|uniref:OmpA family protein n=1 Tax=Maribacter zhoushanensis TaxID=3030012 RepID=UPI0023ED0738|nr:OmpA family protein [Maribacter zhoushanensis]MDF4202252.1 OmpA family protein [Maribacter zhoushanensis]